MVEFSEKLVRPSLGPFTGFVSASPGTAGPNAPFRPSATLQASFVAQSNCVKRAPFDDRQLDGRRQLLRSIRRECAGLIARSVDDMQNVDHSPVPAVIDQIFTDRKAENAWRNLISLSPSRRVVGQNSKPLFERVDQPIGNVNSGMPGPVGKNLIHLLLGFF
jgi:hypothetical protein